MPTGLFVVAVAVIVMVLFFDLSSIASIGSAVALMIFGLVTLRPSPDQGRHRREPVHPARCAVATTVITLLTFVFTTLIKEPASIVTLLGIVIASAILDVAWSRSRERGATASA